MSGTEPEPRTIHISGGWLLGVFVISVLLAPLGCTRLFDGDFAFGGFLLALGCSGFWWVLVGTLTSRTPLVAVDTTGICDRRVARQFIRWVDVLSVQPVRAQGRVHGALLALRPQALRELQLPPLERIVLMVRKWTGFEGVAIMAWGTQVDGQQLYNWCLAYSRAHKFEVDKENV